MAEKISAEQREHFGKGAARKLRAAGRIPAVIYGHGTAPVHISLPGHETALIIRKANAVLDLDIAGKNQTVLVKDVQKDPVRQIIEHLDLLVLRSGELVEVEIPIRLEGEPLGGTVATLDLQTLLIQVLATSIPEHVVVSIEGADEGTQITAGDIVLPEGAKLSIPADTIVVGVVATRAEAAEEAAEPAAASV